MLLGIRLSDCDVWERKWLKIVTMDNDDKKRHNLTSTVTLLLKETTTSMTSSEDSESSDGSETTQPSEESEESEETSTSTLSSTSSTTTANPYPPREPVATLPQTPTIEISFSFANNYE